MKKKKLKLNKVHSNNHLLNFLYGPLSPSARKSGCLLMNSLFCEYCYEPFPKTLPAAGFLVYLSP